MVSGGADNAQQKTRKLASNLLQSSQKPEEEVSMRRASPQSNGLHTLIPFDFVIPTHSIFPKEIIKDTSQIIETKTFITKIKPKD